MSKYVIGVFTAIALVLGLVSPAAAATAPSRPSVSEMQKYIFTKTNEARKAHGLKPLKLNSSLNSIAMACSTKQAKANRMAHCTDYYKKYPGGWTSAAENVAFGYDYKKVVAGWMNSPGHKRNILSKSTDIGIGVAFSSRGLPYYTQNFAQYKQFGGTVAISGTAKVGKKLVAKPAKFPSGTSFTYKWSANGATISKATGSSYTIPKSLKGKTVKVTVTAKKYGYSPVSRTSKATGKILG